MLHTLIETKKYNNFKEWNKRESKRKKRKLIQSVPKKNKIEKKKKKLLFFCIHLLLYIVSTFPVFHLPMSRLKLVALWNATYINRNKKYNNLKRMIRV